MGQPLDAPMPGDMTFDFGTLVAPLAKTSVRLSAPGTIVGSGHSVKRDADGALANPSTGGLG